VDCVRRDIVLGASAEAQGMKYMWNQICTKAVQIYLYFGPRGRSHAHHLESITPGTIGNIPARCIAQIEIRSFPVVYL
jgi:hypothetical protein